MNYPELLKLYEGKILNFKEYYIQEAMEVWQCSRDTAIKNLSRNEIETQLEIEKWYWENRRNLTDDSRWGKIKFQVKSRDNFTCQRCGIVLEDLPDNYRLEVHHIIPSKNFKNRKESDVLSNLITYCTPCHRKREAEVRKIFK